jgi:fused signal recognition particle receptor
VFNWFRRQFNEQKEEQQAAPEQGEATEAVQETEAVEEEAAQPEDDYLSWAKAAYQNIQQRQGTQPATTPVEEAPETPEQEEFVEPVETETTAKEEIKTPEPVAETQIPPTEAAAEPTEIEEPVAETQARLEEPVAEAEEAKIEVREEPEEITEVEATPEAQVTETEAPDTETKEEPQAEPAAATPAWMKKSGGLEKLKETAIEIEPEGEPVPLKAEEEEVELDEEFIWSARVLAAQGRTPDDVSEEEISWLKQLRQGLGKTRRGLVNQLKAIVGQGPLNKDAVMQIEDLLLQADVGIEATDYIIEKLQAKLREEALPADGAIAYLKEILRDILDRPLENYDDPTFIPEKDILNIWLVTGVNGAGKTTTIGKIAHLSQKSGYSCLIGAADTFRAAAVEQVKVWGERSNTPVIANPGKNTDPAAVVYDAISAAKSRNTELLLVDTAGRLQNKKNLMEELAKIRRIIDKKAPDANIESLLVLDATLGQNGLRQAQVFSEAAKLSGVILTKLDGTAKGGVALAVAQQMNLPIRFIGAGEGIEDLRPFSSYEFVEALLSG